MDKKTEKIVYDVKEIQAMLGISKDTAYELINSGSFRVLRVGKNFKIPKESFNRWLEGDNGENVKDAN